ncbi:glycosyltransferase family 4 protein [Thalassolituus sp. LLYu03]|uniref:glycosyltransferase family 4 protein n=1 Tax=Thalassolituus sp. LLYu03 TaxID=3421656 RepID=UPI003D2C5148
MSSRPLTRVTIVTETYAPEINGVANTLGHLVQGLNARGVQVQVIRPKQSSADRGDELNVTLPGLPIPGYSGLRFGLPVAGRIRKALQNFRPDAIYVATEGPMGWAAVSSARRLGIRVISGFHTNFHQYIEHYRLGWLENATYRYLRWFHNRTAATLVPTGAQRDELTRHGFANVSVLSRGVDSQLFSPQRRRQELRRQWGVKDDDLVLIYVGRIAPEKNMGLALSAYQTLRANDDRIRLVLVGDGPALDGIREQHPEVICCGMQRGEALAEHYASGDIFLFPSLTDTFGNVVTEALASGLAVVSFDYAAGHEHIRHNDSGMLAPFADAAGFLRHVSTLADCPNQLQLIRTNARRRAECIGWDQIVSEFLQRLSGARTGEINHGTEQKPAAKRAVV